MYVIEVYFSEIPVEPEPLIKRRPQCNPRYYTPALSQMHGSEFPAVYRMNTFSQARGTEQGPTVNSSGFLKVFSESS